MNPLEILVLGGGAIGSFYGGLLAKAGAKVSLLCRSNYQVVKEKGLHFKSVWPTLHNHHFIPAYVCQDVQDYLQNYLRKKEKNPKLDYLIISTKVLPETVNHNLEILKTILTLYPQTVLCLWQNGLDIEKPYKKAFKEQTLISGLAHVGVSQTSPGVIEHLDFGHLVLGDYPQGVSIHTQKLAELFTSLNVPCSTHPEIIKARWHKLVWNAAFNTLSVLTHGLTTDQILASKEMEGLVKNIMQEVLLIADKDGYPLSENCIPKYIDETRKMTPYKTSMLLDYEHHKPLEIEAILGNALQIAREHHLSTPHLTFLYTVLKVLSE